MLRSGGEGREGASGDVLWWEQRLGMRLVNTSVIAIPPEALERRNDASSLPARPIGARRLSCECWPLYRGIIGLASKGDTDHGLASVASLVQYPSCGVNSCAGVPGGPTVVSLFSVSQSGHPVTVRNCPAVPSDVMYQMRTFTIFALISIGTAVLRSRSF